MFHKAVLIGLFFLMGCAPRALIRKSVTKVYDASPPHQEIRIQVYVDGEWWTVERYQRALGQSINWEVDK